MDPTTLPKILYIEDTPAALLLVRRVLGDRYILLEADNPLDGIELALDTQPDLILVDINLPDMSGREVATRLSTLLPEVPLVALTADITRGARERALVAGCVGFMSKPIDIDIFEDQLKEFINGKREVLPDEKRYSKEYHAEVVEHLETKVRELTRMAEQNTYLNEQNKHVIHDMQRHQRLLEAGANVSRSITSILDLDALLQTAVDIICKEFEFYYAGIFLLDKPGQWAVLRAGHGNPGKAMLAENHRLDVQGQSMIGEAIRTRSGVISADVGDEISHFKNPHLADTRSEMALPLIDRDNILGALSVQSKQVNAFTNADITALQALADQIAVAIENANLLSELESANQELVRTKTYEAIATATGETIHWVGNKAAPIPGSAERIREDLLSFLAIFQTLMHLPPAERAKHPFSNLIDETWQGAASLGLELPSKAEELYKIPSDQLSLMVELASTLEDLEIIKQSAEMILNIKEDLIGPGRLAKPTHIDLPALLEETISGMGLPSGVVVTSFGGQIPQVYGDAHQIGRVLINLIKNAWEALQEQDQPKIQVTASPAYEQSYVQIQIKDNGPGIPPDILDKIWVSFFTTKGDRGGTGLGLSACMEIITQSSGKIWVESKMGEGASFFILLPAAT
jgi:signal transduction histidine kinase/DNA-binding NarL/FixJ family response regulator